MRWRITHQTCRSWIVLSLLLFTFTAHAEQKQLSLVTAALPPLGPSESHRGFLEGIAQEAFSRIGYQVKVTVLPGERALINVNTGIDDGDMFRAPGFEAAYPNLVQVPESIGIMEFMAYTNRPDIKTVTWDSLYKYVVAYAVGWKIYDRMVKAREVTRVRSINELFPLLQKGRADLVLLDRWQGSYLAQHQGVRFTRLEPPLAKVKMFMYLNKKYRDLIPGLVGALRSMKQDGSYQRIADATLKPY